MRTIPPRKIQSEDKTDRFDCRNAILNGYLKNHALKNQEQKNSSTYVTCIDGQVVGYYTITLASILYKNAPKAVQKGHSSRFPIPALLLACLGVNYDLQKQGIGQGLMKDAFKRAVLIAEQAGCRALLIYAADQKAKDWYMQFGPEQSPVDDMHLLIPIATIEDAMKKQV
ncbi:MAG: hypothetical protein JKY80_05170 [Mariprofundaceae bacterium]|nr:hypothetical protein [Mariprofundaceae bacterium]